MCSRWFIGDIIMVVIYSVIGISMVMEIIRLIMKFICIGGVVFIFRLVCSYVSVCGSGYLVMLV